MHISGWIEVYLQSCAKTGITVYQLIKKTLSAGDKNNIYLCSKLKALEMYQNSLIVLNMLVLLRHSLLKGLLNASI